MKPGLMALAGIVAAGPAAAQYSLAPLPSQPVIAAGATAARTMPERFADRINVLDFGADPSGTQDSLAAFNAAAAARAPSGGDVRIEVPRGTYRMSATFNGNERKVTLDIAPGTIWTGAATPYYVARQIVTDGGRMTVNVNAAPSGSSAVVGETANITNTSTTPGTGWRYNYVSNGGPANDIAYTRLSRWANPVQGWGLWDVVVTPVAAKAPWGVVNAEINPTNRGPDRGWQDRRGQPTWSGGYQFVPERAAWQDGPNGIGTNVLFAMAVAARNDALNNAGISPKFYNGLLIEHDAIGPDGRGIYIAGDAGDVAAGRTGDYPHTALQIGETWKTGIRLDGATLLDGVAVKLAAGQAVAFTADATRSMAYADGKLAYAAAGRPVLELKDDGVVHVSGRLVLAPATPAKNDPCTPGQISVDASHLYVCAAANTWRRVALSDW